MFSRILLAYDGSDDANRAAAAAAELADHPGARLHVLHVFSLLPPDTGTASGPFLRDRETEARQTAAAWALSSRCVVEGRAHHALAAQPVPDTFHQENGDPAAVIVRVAAQEAFDVIVMGCRGMGPALRTQLGSVSDWVSRHAPCPVLIVRESSHSREEKTTNNRERTEAGV